ncbi:hypothetical protein SAMN05444678_11748 [Sphingomonas sp. YR710]|jgi:hypothetical protein|nr:hypothetical protein SAMN05444678_11748 [Sphingomonas sp. YR710]
MLTHIQITSAKPTAKPFNLSDSQGLFLTVQPTARNYGGLAIATSVGRRPFTSDPGPR